jgi:hypothetical protein
METLPGGPAAGTVPVRASPQEDRCRRRPLSNSRLRLWWGGLYPERARPSAAEGEIAGIPATAGERRARSGRGLAARSQRLGEAKPGWALPPAAAKDCGEPAVEGEARSMRRGGPKGEGIRCRVDGAPRQCPGRAAGDERCRDGPRGSPVADARPALRSGRPGRSPYRRRSPPPAEFSGRAAKRPVEELAGRTAADRPGRTRSAGRRRG